MEKGGRDENLTSSPKTGFLPPCSGTLSAPLAGHCSVSPFSQQSAIEQARSIFGGVQTFCGRVFFGTFLHPSHIMVALLSAFGTPNSQPCMEPDNITYAHQLPIKSVIAVAHDESG